MALSKRFTSITSAADPGSPDEDAYDDEILQRLLKKPTNYSKIVPSKLDFQPCRDVVTAEASDDELDEDWADDFKSLLKSCGSKRSEIIGEYTAANENVVENDINNYDKLTNITASGNVNECVQNDGNDTHPLAEYSYTDLSGGKDSSSVHESCKIQDHVAEYENDDSVVKDKFLLLEQETKKNTKSSEVTVCKSGEKAIGGKEQLFKRKSNSKKSLFSPKQRPEAEKCLKDENRKSPAQRKDKGIKVCDNKVEPSRKGGSKNCNQFKKMEQSCKKHRKDHYETCKELSNSENCHSEKQTNVNFETVRVKDKRSENSEQKQQDTDFTLTNKLTNKQAQTDTDFEDTFAKTTQNNILLHVDHEAVNKQNNRNSMPSESMSELPLKARNNEAKKNKPLVIKEATSFPLDELLPEAVPCKKPRTSLDSNINHNRDFPISARKRHKSEMLTSNKGYIKKQKVETEQRADINEREFESKNPYGSVSYIPEDVKKLLAAVDTNQSLLSFFRQKLHSETGACNMMSEEKVQAPSSSKPAGFYTERTDKTVLNKSLHSRNKDLESNNSSEELFHLLVQQCSELVKTEEDRWKLQSLVNLLKSESGSEFAGTGFTPELENDNSPPPPSPSRNSPPSPYSPESKLCATQTFEGRTLLKGGVEARHIPKTFLAKLGKSRPIDPRTYSASEIAHVLPLPKFAEEFWKKEKVKQLRKKDLVIKSDFGSKTFPSSKTHKNVNSNALNFEPEQHSICHEQNQSRVLNKGYMSGRLDENQNLLRDEKVHIIKETAIAGVQDPGFYAAVADIFSGDETVKPEYQVKAYNSYGIEAGLETNNANDTSAFINGNEMQQNDSGHRKKTVSAGLKCAQTGKPFQSQVHTETDKNVSVVNKGTPLKSIQIGPCIGIVKPMPLNPQLQNEVRIGQTQFVDVDVRHIGMDLSSDIEEGEINDTKVDKEISLKSIKGIVKHANKKKEKNEERILDRIKKCESQRTDSDSSSSCSVSSENRNHKRSWRRNDHYNYRTERNKRSRSRYSSCSSVDSRSSDRTYGDRQRDYRPAESYRSHRDGRRFNRGTHRRQDNTSKFSDRKSYHTGKSGFDQRRTERSSDSRGTAHRAYIETSKGFSDDKRHVRKVKQQSEGKIMHSTNSKRETRCSAEATDLEEERFLLDYKEKYGSKSSFENHVSSKSHPVAQPTALPDYYKADREFLNYSLKKIDMADKVKHDYVANSSTLKTQEKQEGSGTQIASALKNRKEKHCVNTVTQSKSVLGSVDSNSNSTVKRSCPAADGTGCFKYSDMFSLADLEESENFIFKSKK